LEITKLPASLNEANVRITDKVRDGLIEKIRFRLKISIKDGNIITLHDITVLYSLLYTMFGNEKKIRRENKVRERLRREI
jgi:hypothetical protein